MKNLILPILLLFTSCLPLESKPTSSSLHVAAGDILVSSSVLDSVVQFDKNGNYKRVLWRTQLASETIGGLGWLHTSNEILISVDGTPDRVVAVSVIDGDERVLVNNVNITGTMRTAIQLADSRDLVISELATMERATQDGVRETHTAWPVAVGVITNVQDVAPLSTGGFVAASSTMAVRTYNDSLTPALTAVATASLPAGITGAYGVTETSSGDILVAWEGAATDYLSLYSPSLTLIGHVFGNNQGLLTAPRGVAVKKNGNYLVADNTYDYVLEITPGGSEVQRIGLGFLDAPYSVLVVPDFSQ